jgi:hypothetical protein
VDASKVRAGAILAPQSPAAACFESAAESGQRRYLTEKSGDPVIELGEIRPRQPVSAGGSTLDGVIKSGLSTGMPPAEPVF